MGYLILTRKTFKGKKTFAFILQKIKHREGL